MPIYFCLNLVKDYILIKNDSQKIRFADYAKINAFNSYLLITV